MLVAGGDHAINDMASEEEDSWESILKSNGFSVKSYIKGLGEIEAIQNIYLEHLEKNHRLTGGKKMKKKNFISILLILVLSLSLITACSNEKNSR